jgi:hypothetical protein
MDRRHRQEFRLIIPRELSHGWLAVQGATVKFRVAPIPDGWINLSDHDLAALVMRSSSNAGRASADGQSSRAPQVSSQQG